jgi:predicted DNA-binding transcriptional regulator AlpA
MSNEPAAPPPDSAWFTRRELAAFLRCQESTIAKLVKRGEIPPPVVLNWKFVRWRRSAIEARLRQLEEVANA